MREVRRKRSPKIEKHTTQVRAQQRLESRGMQKASRPAGEFPELLVEEDFSTWSDVEVVHQMGVFGRWAEYAATELASAEAIEEQAERIHRRLRDQRMLQESGTVTAAKAVAGLSDDVIEAEEEYASARAYRKLVQGVLANLDRSQSILSRELTRRVGREHPERRSAKWGGG